MILDQFWLTDAQFSKIAPHLPTDTRSKARVDDRRVISGIVQMLKSSGRWVARLHGARRGEGWTICILTWYKDIVFSIDNQAPRRLQCRRVFCMRPGERWACD